MAADKKTTPDDSTGRHVKRNADKAIAFLIECDEDGLWTMTHCRTQGTPIAEAIHAAKVHPSTSRDLYAICQGQIGLIMAGYMERRL
jgi:hypothetical protein